MSIFCKSIHYRSPMKLPQLTLRDLVWLVLLPFLHSSALGDNGDGTLEYYLGKCDLAIVGEVLQPPHGTRTESGVAILHCRAKIIQVMKGDLRVGEEIKFDAIQFSSEK